MFVISLQAQTDSDSDDALNSATEISTDSEFDQDPVNHEPPKIFIDDSHLRKHTARVHMKQSHVEYNTKNQAPTHQNPPQNVHLKFKPLVEVDPSIVRAPLKNPLPGNYLLSKTASTEGIASKKSLELKKRYLLGESGIGNSVLKSDSASALDTKLKTFHSNISECQKLLNPAAEISPSMQTFLQRIDRNNELNRSQHSISVKVSKDVFNNNQEEKENRSIDSNMKVLEFSETVNTALIENKMREISPEVPKTQEIIEIVDLVTPEKKQPIVDFEQIEIPKSTIAENKQFIENMEKSASAHETNMKIKTKLDSLFIDLTGDSPTKDRSLEEQNNNATLVPDIISNLSMKSNKDDEGIERPRSPAHETTIEVPQMWTKSKEIDTDSLSNDSSSSASLEDIPHFILDSTTSPETQNETRSFHTQAAPRLEVRDSSGELMQIDSLMIVNGQYVGDPEDLPLFNEQLPESPSEKDVTQVQHESPSLPSINRPALKFDTKNENKLESLKNLPLIVSQEDVPVAPKSLHLRFNDQASSPSDGDKTPLVGHHSANNASDSETEVTCGQGLTETELSDWMCDDFVDVEFAMNSGKGTIKKNRKQKQRKSTDKVINNTPTNHQPPPSLQAENGECGILKNLAIEEIDFMDTGSEDSCIETHFATNRAMFKNHGYVKFIDHQHHSNFQNAYNAYDQPTTPKSKEHSMPIAEAINTAIADIDFIVQGASILENDLKTPMNEIAPDDGQLLDSLNASDGIEEDSLGIIDDKNQESLPTTITDTTEELTIVTSPLESLPRNLIKESSATPINTTTPSSTVITSSSISTSGPDLEPIRFDRNTERTASSTSRMSREQIEEMGGYEEYVKTLQMKIAQISSGRDSLEKKTRRKLSKSDLLGSDGPQVDVIKPVQVEPPQTLTMKLEELTKERTKQKDIIHDLVMDKLQAKKQMNAEKRMTRSRNRNLFMGSNNAQSSSFPSSPSRIPSESTVSSDGHSNVITYRESVNNLKENQDAVEKQIIEPKSPKMDPPSIVPQKIHKTQSFNYCTRQVPLREDQNPVPPPRNRLHSVDITSADKMREDARARAKLKSNEDLGLSPEEKILMLRRRYNLMQTFDGHPNPNIFQNGRNKSDDMKYCEKKLSISKSFNDISHVHALDGVSRAIDFVSDPNLVEVVEKETPLKEKESPKSTKSQRRDSERRKSLIGMVSDFFHKKKDQNASNKDLANNSPTSVSKDRLSETSSLGVFSRFRLSPKSKDASKDKAKVCWRWFIYNICIGKHSQTVAHY